MNKKLICKCLIGLLLFFTLQVASPLGVPTAKAGSIIDKEKSDDYRLNLKSNPLVIGKSFTLRVYNLSDGAKVSFKSDDSEIASVLEDGTITANKVGITSITVTIKDGTISSSLTCEVTVGPPAFSVKITRSRIILGLDNSDLLRVILKPSNTAEDARFSSYDSSIASVSSIGGRITAKKFGLTYLFAVIDAENNDGSRKYAVCTVIVTSTEDAPLLENYFSEHPELDLISEPYLSKALEELFNGTSESTATMTTKVSNTSLVEALDQYLNVKFDLVALRKEMIARTLPSQSNTSNESAAK